MNRETFARRFHFAKRVGISFCNKTVGRTGTLTGRWNWRSIGEWGRQVEAGWAGVRTTCVSGRERTSWFYFHVGLPTRFCCFFFGNLPFCTAWHNVTMRLLLLRWMLNGVGRNGASCVQWCLALLSPIVVVSWRAMPCDAVRCQMRNSHERQGRAQGLRAGRGCYLSHWLAGCLASRLSDSCTEQRMSMPCPCYVLPPACTVVCCFLILLFEGSDAFVVPLAFGGDSTAAVRIVGGTELT